MGSFSATFPNENLPHVFGAWRKARFHFCSDGAEMVMMLVQDSELLPIRRWLEVWN